MQYTPANFEGEHVEQIFADLIFSNSTVENGLITFVTDVKNEMNITEQEGSLEWGEYKEFKGEADLAASDSLKMKDVKVKPVKIEAFTTFGMDNLRMTRFGASMLKGAANVASNEFEKAVLEYTVPRLGLSFESKIWNSITADSKTAVAAMSGATVNQKAYASGATASITEGLITRLILGGAVSVNGTTLTETNLKAEFNKIWKAIPAELLDAKNVANTRIYGSKKLRQLILAANQNETYRDIFTVAGQSISFNGVEIVFVPVPDNAIVVADKTKLVAATDLLSDMNDIKVGKINEYSDKMFLRAVATLDTQVIRPNQAVLYI